MVDQESGPEGVTETEDLPDRIHDYRIIGRLGRGGFSDVYLARLPGSFRLVALKVLRAELDDRVREQVVGRFHTEENVARAVVHPAVVRVVRASPPGAMPAYIAMEYVDGQPFCQYFRRQSDLPDLSAVARLAHQVAEAMAEAHALGIVHRDLKPDNVLVTAGRPSGDGPQARVLDFGIAKAPPGLSAAAADPAAPRYATELGTVMGSPPFMAPEQNGAAHAVTGKADVFALGTMLLLVVCLLDESELFGVEFMTARSETMQQLFARRPDLPAPWRALLRDMLALDPQQRPDMNEAARRLQRLAQPNEDFAAAVEAWLTQRTLPSARRLRGWLEWAESAPSLMADEQRFLRQASVARLPRRAWVRGAALGALPAAVALVALGAAASRFAPAVPAVAALEDAVLAAPAPPPAPSAARSGPHADTQPSARSELSGRSPICDPPASARASNEAALSRLQRELDGCQRAQRADRRTTEVLRHKLSASDSRLADLEIDAAEAQHSLQSAQAELERSRETAAEQGKKAFACNQQLESRNRQLEESMQRWRVCAKARGVGAAAPPTASDASNDAPSPESESESDAPPKS